VKYEIANPDPGGTIESFKSLGYTIEAAVADLVDNCITAQARNINVEFTWDGRNSWIAVTDDGVGMTESELVTAMTIAAKGPSSQRSSKDLGRFGMGLKTASFSQARQLIVTSGISGGTRAVRAWDLDVVRQSGEWRLLQEVDAGDVALLDRLWTGQGTVVLWKHLHRFDVPGITPGDPSAKRHFYDDVRTRIEPHLGMVFSRFLDGKRLNALTVNTTNPVRPWDPFLRNQKFVQQLPAERIPIGGHVMTVEGFVLPHPRHLSEEQALDAAGPRGWLEQEGFYVYRRDRLIVAGDWLGIRGYRKEDKYILARISIDVPAELDADWSIDVRKSATVPPLAARPHLRRIGDDTRRRAAEVLSHRGRIITREHGADFIYAWTVEQRNGQVACRINRRHPLVQQILRSASSESADAKALLRLLEETVPVAALRVLHQAETVDDQEPFMTSTGIFDPEAVKVAERIQAAYMAQGLSRPEARRRISIMSPFDQIPGFWHDSLHQESYVSKI
jgi:Histidine kinase-, DNA gyrase B-, and HSP90-like ATPase